MELSDRDRSMLAGEQGPAPKMAMSILTRMGAVRRARRMLDIEAAHIDSTLYMGEATLEFAEKLAGWGARVVVPTSLNVSGVDESGWREWAVPAEWAEKAQRQMKAYASMGTQPTWTCAPYQVGFKPKFGQQIAWGESNAIVFANSVIGARTERYPDLLDICAAITGRVPAVGLHLEENRAGELLFELRDMAPAVQESDEFYPVLGHLIGNKANGRTPVVVGLEVPPTEDQLKALGAAAASSGSVALFHLVGVTPEAPTLEEALKGRQPHATIEVNPLRMHEAWQELTTHDGEALHMVVLGSPHFSLQEFANLAPMLEGRTKSEAVRFLVTTSRAVAALAEKAGFLAAVRAFGGELTLDTCILTTPMLPDEIRVLMTNSAKYAYYAPGLLNTEVVFGGLEDCVKSAVVGTVSRQDPPWSLA